MSEEIYLDYNENTGKFEEPHEPFATIDVETEEDFNRLKKALEDAEKYKWHDLRKDPKDLPDIGENVLTCGVHHGYEVIKFRGARHSEKCGSLWDWKKNTIKTVIAWRYIEPLGGEDDGEIR